MKKLTMLLLISFASFNVNAEIMWACVTDSGTYGNISPNFLEGAARDSCSGAGGNFYLTYI